MKKNFLALTGAVALMGAASTASATSIGMLVDGGTGNAVNNMNYVVGTGGLTPTDGADSWTALNAATFNSMTTAQLLATYDTLVMPWYVNGTMIADWNTVLLPYLNGGGNILWEDPVNIGDLSGSGLSLSGGNHYSASGESEISLVSPFGDDGASGFFHIHYSILGASSDWSVWSTDIYGGIHGVYREFENGGRMVLGVSDNLYHPNFADPGQSDHYQLTLNQLNWLNTGSIDGVVPAPQTLALLGLGLAGIGFSAKRKKKAA